MRGGFAPVVRLRLAAAAGFARFGVARRFRGAAVLDFARFGMARVGRTITVAVSNFKLEVFYARYPCSPDYGYVVPCAARPAPWLKALVKRILVMRASRSNISGKRGEVMATHVSRSREQAKHDAA